MEENKKKEYEYIRDLLEQQKNQLQEQLTDDISIEEKADLIGKSNLIKFSQELLRRCFEYDVIPGAIWRRVPMPQHEWSEYRLMEDVETEDRQSWRELDDFRLDGGEVIIG